MASHLPVCLLVLVRLLGLPLISYAHGETYCLITMDIWFSVELAVFPLATIRFISS